jgi:hypothetical protein
MVRSYTVLSSRSNGWVVEARDDMLLLSASPATSARLGCGIGTAYPVVSCNAPAKLAQWTMSTSRRLTNRCSDRPSWAGLASLHPPPRSRGRADRRCVTCAGIFDRHPSNCRCRPLPWYGTQTSLLKPACTIHCDLSLLPFEHWRRSASAESNSQPQWLRMMLAALP